MKAPTPTSDSITVTVPSAATPGAWHTLTLFDDGVIICSCPGYYYRHDCRHAREERARRDQWESRTCGQCFASGPQGAFTAVTTYEGGHGHVTTHACRNTAACGARRQAAA